MAVNTTVQNYAKLIKALDHVMDGHLLSDPERGAINRLFRQTEADTGDFSALYEIIERIKV